MKIGYGKFILGDCLRILKGYPAESIDMVVTSPPYDDLRSYDSNSEWDFEKTAIELSRVIKLGGVIVWNVADATVNGSETGSSFRQALFFKDMCKLNIHDTMIWKKSNFSNPSSNRYHQTFEFMFIFSKGKPATFNGIKDRKNVYAGKLGPMV